MPKETPQKPKERYILPPKNFDKYSHPRVGSRKKIGQFFFGPWKNGVPEGLLQHFFQPHGALSGAAQHKLQASKPGTVPHAERPKKPPVTMDGL